jgi:hypothetical protein
MACILNSNHNAEEDDSSIDWQLPFSFVKKRHVEKIEGANAITQTWRMKERVRLFEYHDNTPSCLVSDINLCTAPVIFQCIRRLPCILDMGQMAAML